MLEVVEIEPECKPMRFLNQFSPDTYKKRRLP